jgi:hypothetical protein
VADAAATLTTIYALTSGGDRRGHSPVTGAIQYEPAERIFGPDERLQAAPTDLREWAPELFGDYEWSPADYSTNVEMPYAVTGVRTYFVRCLFAGDVLVLELRLRGSLNSYIDAQRHAFDRKVKKQLVGKDLLEAAASHVNGAERDQLRKLKLGQDKHQIMVLSRADAGLIFSESGDAGSSRQVSDSKAMSEMEKPLDLRQIDFAALGRLMFKDVKINYRTTQVPISLPDDINGPDHQMVAVWATNTVVCGIEAYKDLGPDYGNLAARRTRELTYAAAQIVAAANRCREIRMATLSVLKHVNLPASQNQDADHERAEQVKYEHDLHDLEFDLTFGADVYRGPALVQGGRPLERYQEAVRAESGFNASVKLTHRMVEQLTSIVTTRRQLFEVTVSMEISQRQAHQVAALNEVSQHQAEQLAALHQVSQRQADQVAALRELLDRTEGVRTASVVVASIAIVVSCVGLFAALATVPVSTNDFLGPQFRSGAVAALSVIFAGAFGFGVYWASKRQLSNTARNVVRIAVIVLALFCVAGLVVALVLWSHSGTAVHLYALVGGLVAGLAAIILGVCLVNWGGHDTSGHTKTGREPSLLPDADDAPSEAVVTVNGTKNEAGPG